MKKNSKYLSELLSKRDESLAKRRQIEMVVNDMNDSLIPIYNADQVKDEVHRVH